MPPNSISSTAGAGAADAAHGELRGRVSPALIAALAQIGQRLGTSRSGAAFY